MGGEEIMGGGGGGRGDIRMRGRRREEERRDEGVEEDRRKGLKDQSGRGDGRGWMRRARHQSRGWAMQGASCRGIMQ